VVIVLDSSLLSILDANSGLKEKGIVIINTKKTTEQIRSEFGITGRLATVDATTIAQESLGVPIVNTTMVGALIKATSVITLEAMKEPLENRFGRLAERNIKAMERAYQETLIGE
jgi:2-oxoacid:acceptor oxidoreductase gamma subunit (pyruvate/2-ketoisovalerate family)